MHMPEKLQQLQTAVAQKPELNYLKRKAPRFFAIDNLIRGDRIWRGPMRSSFVREDLKPNKTRKIKLKERRTFPFQPELLNPELISQFFDVLTTDLVPQDFDRVSNKEFNYLLHTAKLLLDAASSHAIELTTTQQWQLRRFLDFLLVLEEKYHQKKSDRPWKTTLGYPIEQDRSNEIKRLLKDDVGARQILNQLRKLTTTDLTVAKPLSVMPLTPKQRLKLSPGDDPSHPIPAFRMGLGEYTNQYFSLKEITQLQRTGGVKRQLETIVNYIRNEFSSPVGEPQLLFDKQLLAKAFRPLNGRIGVVAENISISDFETELKERVFTKLVGTDWDEVRKIAGVYITLLENAIILTPTPRETYTHDDSFADLEAEALIQGCAEFMKHHLTELKSKKEIAPHKNYLWLLLLFLLISTGEYAFAKTGGYIEDWQESDFKELVADVPFILNNTANSMVKIIDQVEDYFEDISGQDSGWVPEALRGLSGLVGEGNTYTGPENTQNSFSELLKRDGVELIRNQSSFMSRQALLFSYSTDNPLAIEWAIPEELPSQTNISVDMRTSSVGEIVEALGQSGMSDIENITNLSDLYELQLQVLPFSNTQPLPVLDSSFIRPPTMAEQEKLVAPSITIQVPTKATHYILVADNANANTTIKSWMSIDGSRYLDFLHFYQPDSGLIVYFVQDPSVNMVEYLNLPGSQILSNQLVVLSNRTFQIDANRNVAAFALPQAPDEVLEYRSSRYPSEELKHFIQNDFGIDFDQMYYDVQSPMPLPPLPTLSQGDEEIYPGLTDQVDVYYRVLAAANRQLLEKGVRYSTYPEVNKFLSSQDVRSFFLVAKHVGLDCDGLSLITLLTANAFLSEYNSFTFTRMGDPTPVEVTLNSHVSSALISGELDADNDKAFTSMINHARVLIGNAQWQKNFEATTSFQENPDPTDAELDALEDALKETLDKDLVTIEFSKAHQMATVTALSGLLLSVILFRSLFAVAKKSEIDLILSRDSFSRSKRKSEKLKLGFWYKLLPQLKALEGDQIAYLAELISVLFSDQFEKPDAEKISQTQELQRIIRESALELASPSSVSSLKDTSVAKEFLKQYVRGKRSIVQPVIPASKGTISKFEAALGSLRGQSTPTRSKNASEAISNYLREPQADQRKVQALKFLELLMKVYGV